MPHAKHVHVQCFTIIKQSTLPSVYADTLKEFSSEHLCGPLPHMILFHPYLSKMLMYVIGSLEGIFPHKGHIALLVARFVVYGTGLCHALLLGCYH